MLAFVALSLSLLLLSVHAANWYTVEWNGVTFTAMSGDMVVPKLPQAGGTLFLNVGLHLHNVSLQELLTSGPDFKAETGSSKPSLDGRSGVWWIDSAANTGAIGDGFYGTPSLPWGNGFNVNPGDTVHFSFTSSGTVWTCTLSSNGKSATTLSLDKYCPGRAIFAAELTNVSFNFGPITYSNVKIISTTAASSWCGRTAHLGTYPYTVTSATASGNVCSIAKIVQNSEM
ncbi:hypothetical protein FPV67DRAFT_1448859 [Lyophyllum atratum]|nr:hypothetical protein FPV67DRAFT_1448859 [Lyophyllum atratum]